MENSAEIFVRALTRYIIPGVVFLVVGLHLPLTIFAEKQILETLRLLEVPQVLIFSVVVGYLLDSLGAYRWTLSYREYERTKDELARRAHDINPLVESNDPDQYLADLWLLREQVYNRLFLARAEWVMILESSCALLVGATVMLGLSIMNVVETGQLKAWEVIAIMVLLGGSYLASVKGIQRMRAHNMKMLRALRDLFPEAEHREPRS